MDGPPAIDETLAMANLKIQKAKLGSHTISPNGKTAAESLEILKRMEADRTDKIATEKAKEERMALALAARIAKMSPEQRADMQRIQEDKAAEKAAKETAKADEKAAKELKERKEAMMLKE